MLNLTNIDPEIFIEEVKKWNASKNTIHKIRAMKKGLFIYFKFTVPYTSEAIQTRILESDFNDFDFVNFAPISTPGVWEINPLNVIANRINEALEKNATIDQHSRNKGILNSERVT